jgi:hypothetical protein
MQAVDLEGLDVELDLSNLGTMNTMFAALFRCVLLSLVLRALGDFAIQLVLYCLLSLPTSLLLIRSE